MVFNQRDKILIFAAFKAEDEMIWKNLFEVLVNEQSFVEFTQEMCDLINKTEIGPKYH